MAMPFKTLMFLNIKHLSINITDSASIKKYFKSVESDCNSYKSHVLISLKKTQKTNKQTKKNMSVSSIKILEHQEIVYTISKFSVLKTRLTDIVQPQSSICFIPSPPE